MAMPCLRYSAFHNAVDSGQSGARGESPAFGRQNAICGFRRRHPTVHSPQSTVHSGQSTVHSPLLILMEYNFTIGIANNLVA